MYVELHSNFKGTAEGVRAKELTSACVHCGFCLATCPTYLESRDERDSPRGRIYLIKQLLESGDASTATHTHLDRCLTCRSCETTCPSGVQYGQLLDIGRGVMERQVKRSAYQRIQRKTLRWVLTRPRLFATLLRLGRLVRPLLPGTIAAKVPPLQAFESPPVTSHLTRTALLLEGCVQQAATPRTNNAARRILAKLGVNLVSLPQAGCCGAVNYHLGAHEDGLGAGRLGAASKHLAVEHAHHSCHFARPQSRRTRHTDGGSLGSEGCPDLVRVGFEPAVHCSPRFPVFFEHWVQQGRCGGRHGCGLRTGGCGCSQCSVP